MTWPLAIGVGLGYLGLEIIECGIEIGCRALVQMGTDARDRFQSPNIFRTVPHPYGSEGKGHR